MIFFLNSYVAWIDVNWQSAFLKVEHLSNHDAHIKCWSICLTFHVHTLINAHEFMEGSKSMTWWHTVIKSEDASLCWNISHHMPNISCCSEEVLHLQSICVWLFGVADMLSDRERNFMKYICLHSYMCMHTHCYVHP